MLLGSGAWAQTLDDLCLEPRLGGQRPVGRGEDPPGRVDGLLEIGAVVDDPGQQLQVRLGLSVAPHRSEHQPWPVASKGHSGNERVQGPLARRDDVHVGRIQGEESTTILQVDPPARHRDPGSEPRPVRLDEAHQHPVRVGGAQIGGPGQRRVLPSDRQLGQQYEGMVHQVSHCRIKQVEHRQMRQL